MENLGIWLIVIVVLLVPAFGYRFWRQAKARKLLVADPQAAKLYTDKGKTLSDGIKVYSLNGQKPVLGLDGRGNFVVLAPGENRLTLGFVTLKDFAASVVESTVTKAPIPAEEATAEIVHTAEAGREYLLSFDKQSGTFRVEPYL